MISRIYRLFFSTPVTSVEPKPIPSVNHPLLNAAEKGDIAEIQTILSYSPPLEILDEMGNTPLILAAAANKAHVVKLLFEHGASLDFRGNNGYTALNVAATNGQMEAAEMLISLGAKLEARSQTEAGSLEGGPTPLWNAVRGRHEKMVHLLIATGANINVQDGDGNSVLAFAVHGGSLSIVEKLLRAGADPKRAGNGATSAIDRARNNDQKDMLELLEGKTSLENLVRQKRLKLFDVQMLLKSKAEAPEKSTNNHLTVTRPTLI